MNVNLTPSITGNKVNIIKGSTQADLDNATQLTKTYRDEAEVFKNSSETNKNATQVLHDNVVYKESLVSPHYNSIDTVANNISSVNSVSSSISNVNTNATNIASINTNAVNISAISTVASNIVDIQNAEENASIATTKAGIATTKANEASVSANSASASATTATTQAGIATTKATEASISASNASTSATNASTSEANALSYKNSASTSATNAATSESNALSYKNSANTSATNASTSATSSATSATNASASATSASNSATTATTKASEASTSASNASTSETNSYKWANNPVDVEVTTGKYSAYHWASKASDLVVNGIIDDVTAATNKTYSSVKINTLVNAKADTTSLTAHTIDTNNPHSVTKSQVGLGNVDNTSDANKNVLSATKLTTARNIAGVSFDGTADINIPFSSLTSKPTTISGYGITDAYTKAEVGTLTDFTTALG